MIKNKPATTPMLTFTASVCEFHQTEDAKRYKEVYLEHCQTSVMGVFSKNSERLLANNYF